MRPGHVTVGTQRGHNTSDTRTLGNRSPPTLKWCILLIAELVRQAPDQSELVWSAAGQWEHSTSVSELSPNEEADGELKIA